MTTSALIHFPEHNAFVRVNGDGYPSHMIKAMNRVARIPNGIETLISQPEYSMIFSKDSDSGLFYFPRLPTNAVGAYYLDSQPNNITVSVQPSVENTEKVYTEWDVLVEPNKYNEYTDGPFMSKIKMAETPAKFLLNGHDVTENYHYEWTNEHGLRLV